MTDQTDCCDGLDQLTPMSTANAPGQDSLTYRVGLHATFFETMLARLTSLMLPNEDGALPSPQEAARTLDGLTRRDAQDPAIALLDGGAAFLDVLTFYNERILNEGFLRTATERRSLVEIARLMGYTPRPGAASSVHLAFSVEEGYSVLLDTTTKAQSTPGQGEKQQIFEISQPLEARAAWNNLKPRTMTAQVSVTPLIGLESEVYLKGISTNLKTGDPLLTRQPNAELWRIKDVHPDAKADHTRVIVTPWNPTTQQINRAKRDIAFKDGLTAANLRGDQINLDDLTRPTRPQLPGGAYLPRDVNTAFGSASDLAGKLLTSLNPSLAPTLYTAARNQALPTAPLEVYALRAKFSPFGHNAPKKSGYYDDGEFIGYPQPQEWPLSLLDDAPTGDDFMLSLSFVNIQQPDEAMIEARGSAVVTQANGDARLFSMEPIPITNNDEQHTTRIVLKHTDPDEEIVVDVSLIMIPGEIINRLWYVDRLKASFTARSVVINANLINSGRNIRGRALVTLANSDGTSPRRLTDFQLRQEANAAELEITGRLPAARSDNLTEDPHIISLEASNSQITPDSQIVITRTSARTNGADFMTISTVRQVYEATRADYGIQAKGTQIVLSGKDVWFNASASNLDLSLVRNTTIYTQSERLELAEVPVTRPVGGRQIELQQLYDGLQSGRWIIVSGERADVANTSGVMGAELAMIALVTQTHGADDKTDPKYQPLHTTLTLEKPLAYTYKPDKVTIYGNVAEATHGDTHRETLGSGSGARINQIFTLKQKPLTFTPAATTSGIESTLQIYVNDILWHEAPSIIDMGPNDHEYVRRSDNEQNTSILFGDGERGARLPTGVENVRARYRSGMGSAGNVRAAQIDTLGTKPLGVKGVINPLPATGGADPETRDRIRSNLPLAARSLGRLISVRDYEDFTRIFAGIGKASAALLNNGRRSVVHITIAGEADIPIGLESKLYASLLAALRQYGDPNLPIVVAQRELLALVIAADVKRHPDHEWGVVDKAVRAALLNAFSFERRSLGQDVSPSEVISVMQRIPGVEYVDLNWLRAVSEKDAAAAFQGKQESVLPTNQQKTRAAPTADAPSRIEIHLARERVTSRKIVLQPAQLAYLRADVPDTLILNEKVATL